MTFSTNSTIITPGDSYNRNDFRNILEYPLMLPPNHTIVIFGTSIFQYEDEELLDYANDFLSRNLPLNIRRCLAYWIHQYYTNYSYDYKYHMNIIANIETTLCRAEDWFYYYACPNCPNWCYDICPTVPGDLYDPNDIRIIVQYPLTLPPDYITVTFGTSIFHMEDKELLEYANTFLSHNMPLNTRRCLSYWVHQYYTNDNFDYQYHMNIIANIETSLCNMDEWVCKYPHLVKNV